MIYQNKAETYTGGKVVFIPSQSYSSTNHVKNCKKPYHNNPNLQIKLKRHQKKKKMQKAKN